MKRKTYVLRMFEVICGKMIIFAGCGKADKLYDEGMDYIKSQEYEKALECFENAIDNNSEKAEYYIGAGMADNYLGRYEEAINQFSNAFQESENTISNTNNKQLYYGNAIAAYGLKRYDEAIEDCNKALEIKQVDNLDEKINFLLAALYQSKGDYDNAEKIYASIIKANKKSTKAYIARASLYEQVENYDAAQKDYTMAMDIDEECDAAYFGLYNVYSKQNNEEAAVNILNKLIDMDGDETKHDIASGKAYYYLGEYENALKYFDKAEKNGLEEALYYKGLIYVAQSDFDSAKNQFESYIKKENASKNSDAYNQISNCLIEMEDYEQALSYVNKGLELGTTAAEKSLLKNNVIIYEKMGKYKKALTAAKKYIKSYPDDKDMKKELSFIRTRI